MKQGSSLAVAQSSNVISITREKQAGMFQAVQETGAIAAGLVAIAEGCQNEGHATPEDIDRIHALGHMIIKQMAILGVNVAEA